MQASVASRVEQGTAKKHDKKKPGNGEVVALSSFACLVALTVLVFFLKSPYVLAAVLAVEALFIAVTRVKFGALKLLFVPFLVGLPATASVFIASYWVETGSFQLGLTQGGAEALYFLTRIFILVSANIWFVQTTDIRRFAESLRWLCVPEVIVLLITIVFRFFPLVFSEAKRILEVQRSRGLKPLMLLQPRYFLPILIPLLLINMQRASDIAISMELRKH